MSRLAIIIATALSLAGAAGIAVIVAQQPAVPLQEKPMKLIGRKLIPNSSSAIR